MCLWASGRTVAWSGTVEPLHALARWRHVEARANVLWQGFLRPSLKPKEPKLGRSPHHILIKVGSGSFCWHEFCWGLQGSMAELDQWLYPACVGGPI